MPGYGGYSYYTTCMMDINKVGQITYLDTYPALPNGNNVLSLVVNGVAIDFNDAAKYYKVSTVNYLAAGSCNFNNSGVSLWPLNQIVNDTQYYVRDAVIDYLSAQTAPVSPMIEGRLQFKKLTDLTPMSKTLAPTQDAALDGGTFNVWHGGWPYLYAGLRTWLWRQHPHCRAVRRDGHQPELPGQQGESVSVWLDAFQGGANDGELAAYEITSAWPEATMTWKSPWTTPGGDFINTVVGSAPIEQAKVGTWMRLTSPRSSRSG